ncbi:MAG: DUF1232 domain-containing protein [Acetobacteraceae bacterium]|jgi:uncharacterized membrane protein YkvA (DUF1232 family)|nr:DUF1232 domain-containing protein [Acetobacteraceae bacterium]
MFARLSGWAASLKREVAAIAGAARDPRTPLVAKLLAVAIVAYALSPIDLIPDVIPVLGVLDDLLLLPLGIWLVVRMIPAEVLAEHRAAAAEAKLAPSRAGAAIVVALWLAALAALAWIAWQ